MQNWWFPVSIFLLIWCVVLCGCTSPASPEHSPATPSALPSTPQTPINVSQEGFNLNVASLTPGSVLPDIYTCKGAGESPAISWDNVPSGTKSLVLIVDDPDAPAGIFTHWIVYNIPPAKGNLAPAQPNAKVLSNGAQQGDTSAGSRGYYPACPPIGSTHHYVFLLYAVDMDITQPTTDRNSIDWALNGHTIAKTDFVTICKR